jgi:hypothetical protein
MDADQWRLIEELYHAAYERPAAERAAFLDEACAGEVPLRREIESLLAQPVSIAELSSVSRRRWPRDGGDA